MRWRVTTFFMQTLLTVAGIPVTQHDDGSLTWTAGAQIDGDGTGPSHGDPAYQNGTTYRPSLDADEDRYIVVPPQLRLKPDGIVMGCQARIVNTVTGHATDCVVGDVGPARKLGEISIAAAKAVDVPASPTTGGVARKIISYTIFPGRPAIVCGKQYHLQPA